MDWGDFATGACKHGRLYDHCSLCEYEHEGKRELIAADELSSRKSVLEPAYKIQAEMYKKSSDVWEQKWRKTNADLYKQCILTGKMRDKIFELTGEWLDSNMQPVDIEKLNRMYKNI